MTLPSKPTNLHKRLAMGDTLKGYAKGGHIGSGRTVQVRAPTGSVPRPVPEPSTSGNTMGPAERAKRANGVVGMKKGGKC